jgi:predicted nuclease of predicted toxin-antitoxin system
LARATDEQVLERAKLEGRIVVTLDADFHAILARTGASVPSVVRVRVEGLGAIALAHLVATTLDSIVDDLTLGAVATSDGARVRVRRLPLR